MKNLSIIILVFCSVNVLAQTKVDSIFYLLDTVKTPVNDRMWDINADNQFKYYTLKCPSLKFDGMPTFFYSVTDKEYIGRIINKRELKTIKFIGLPALIINF